jgi:hypothetical protein
VKKVILALALLSGMVALAPSAFAANIEDEDFLDVVPPEAKCANAIIKSKKCNAHNGASG